MTEHVWDHRNRLVGVIDRLGEGGPIVQSVEYVCDSQNRWIARSLDPDGAGPEPATATYFVYDDLSTPLVPAGAGSGLKVGQIILHLDGSGRVTNRYLWGPAVDQILADEQLEPDGGTTVLWTLTDHLNTVRDLAVHDPATGATTIVNHLVYDAFGQITHQTDPTLAPLFAFTARPLDPATGLQNNLNRWYDAQVGRWVSEDPIGFAARDANVYRYVGNDPANATDPSGLDRYLYRRWSCLGAGAIGHGFIVVQVPKGYDFTKLGRPDLEGQEFVELHYGCTPFGYQISAHDGGIPFVWEKIEERTIRSTPAQDAALLDVWFRKRNEQLGLGPLKLAPNYIPIVNDCNIKTYWYCTYPCPPDGSSPPRKGLPSNDIRPK